MIHTLDIRSGMLAKTLQLPLLNVISTAISTEHSHRSENLPDIRHVITQVPSTQHYPHGAEKGISHDRPCELHVVFQRHESVQSPYSPLLHCSHCGPSKPDPAWLVRRRTSQYAAQSEHKTTVEETCFADTRSACLASTVLAARVVGIARNLARWSIPPLAACRAVRARSILEAAA